MPGPPWTMNAVVRSRMIKPSATRLAPSTSKKISVSRILARMMCATRSPDSLPLAAELFVERYVSDRDQHFRLLQNPAYCGQKLGTGRTIDRTMVERKAGPHDFRDPDRTVPADERTRLGCADGKDRALGRVDDRVELIDAVA